MAGTAAFLIGSWTMSRSHVMDRLPSCPDIVLLEGTEQSPGGRVYGIDKDARLHLLEVTFTTDFALVDRVASNHDRLCPGGQGSF